MNRDVFMQEARVTARDILQGKENGIMNLVQRAWAEGKRNAEVETLRAAIDEALDKREPKEPPVGAVYPTWWEWLAENGVVDVARIPDGCYGAFITKIEPSGKMHEHIPADIAEKLGIEPKEE